MSEPVTQARPADDDMSRASGWDALLDDLFGLNVRALASMWAILAAPRKVFEAARDVDWLGKYTPSIRLVFTLIAAMVFLRFLWGGEDSALHQMTRDSLTDPNVLGMGDMDQFTQDYLGLWLVLFPFGYFAIHGIVALLLRVWGKGTPAPLRLRLYFAALLPGLLLGVLSTLMMPLLDVPALEATLIPLFVLTFLAYAITVFRGLAGRMAAVARAWRAVLFGFIAISSDLLTTVTVFIVDYAWLYERGPV
ncbi:MAG: hypothetical protein KJ871_08710 [Alphaproteobacteria bacterium]|nr:hypothetical protein [Alphaproteobacteria bacterium]MBU2083350.1 hypothetical protein [Alphaproteobacteria bacterium]MBU2143685.1 hypothetical protein [Alphaproteobacteria bacterium]MBU2195634.1 hypothetical protein [Alphaproteobacteria bacterium]